MAKKKVSRLEAINRLSGNTIIPVVTVGTTNQNKVITYENLTAQLQEDIPIGTGTTHITNADTLEHIPASGFTRTETFIEGLLGKSNTGHTHEISDVDNLQETLDSIYVSGGAPQYNIIIRRDEIVWDDDWVRIVTTSSVNSGKKVINVRLSISSGYGTINLTPIINYPSATNNSGTTPFVGFLLKDSDNLLTKNREFDQLSLSYDITTYTYTIPYVVYGGGINYFNDPYSGTTNLAVNYDSKRAILGDNAINEHSSGDEYHSRYTKYSFEAAFMELDGEGYSGITIETCSNPATMGMLSQSYTPPFAEDNNADIVYKPYVLASVAESVGSNSHILSVGSQGGNEFVRVDITTGTTHFYDNSIAVVARPNDLTTFRTGCTTYGYGTEFMEEGNNVAMNNTYTGFTHAHAIGWGYIINSGYTIVQENTALPFPNCLQVEVGKEISIGTGSTSMQTRTIVSIDNDFEITVDTPINPLETGTTGMTNFIFIPEAKIGTMWNPRKWMDYPNNTIPGYYPNYQSPTTGLIAGKLKKIKMKTGVSWQLVREAARMTASNSTYENGVWTTHWDMYRGFGIINVGAAITYIETNYLNSSTYKGIVSDKLEALHGISPSLQYDDLLPNSPIAKRMVDNKLGAILEYADNAAAVAAGLTVGSFYRTGDVLKVVH